MKQPKKFKPNTNLNDPNEYVQYIRNDDAEVVGTLLALRVGNLIAIGFSKVNPKDIAVKSYGKRIARGRAQKYLYRKQHYDFPTGSHFMERTFIDRLKNFIDTCKNLKRFEKCDVPSWVMDFEERILCSVGRF